MGAPGRESPKTIVVADPTLTGLPFARTMFGRTWVSLISVSNATEAIFALRNVPSLVFLDPDMFTRAEQNKLANLWQEEKFSQVPLTLLIDDPEKDSPLHQVAYFMIQKPLKLSDLVRHAAETLELPLRREARLLVDLTVEVGVANLFFGRTADVSPGGMCLVTERTLQKGERLQISFLLPGLDHIIHCTAHVLWVQQSARTNRFRYGLRFKSLRREDRSIIHRFVGERRAMTRTLQSRVRTPVVLQLEE